MGPRASATVIFEIQSENLCQTAVNSATFNGTMVLRDYNTGMIANSFLVGNKVVASIQLTSVYPIATKRVESTLLCATTDSKGRSCSQNVSKLIKSSYYILNQNVQVEGTKISNDASQISFILNSNNIYLSVSNSTVKHVLEIQIRITFRDLQQEVIGKVLESQAVTEVQHSISNEMFIGRMSRSVVLQVSVVMILLVLVMFV